MVTALPVPVPMDSGASGNSSSSLAGLRIADGEGRRGGIRLEALEEDDVEDLV